ncbi:MAG: DNA mismatch repair protein, partial [Pirellulaceae bacterium]|nr:DNA mismatch repair protein [Pirellulaceae bacterium]
MSVDESSTHTDLGDATAALERYQSQVASIDAERARLKAIDGRFGTVRVVLFFLAITAWLFGYFSDVGSWISITGWVLLGAFIVVVVANEPVRDKLDDLHRIRAVFQRLVSRLNRDWNKLATKRLTEQLATVTLAEDQRDVADDLDLLGHTSLFHFVSMTATAPGIRTLASWLAGTADAGTATE